VIESYSETFILTTPSNNIYLAHSIPSNAHGRFRRPFLPNKDSARYHHPSFPFPRWDYSRSRLSCDCWKLHWYDSHSLFESNRLTECYTASGTVKKVIEINKYLLGTMAGGAGQSYIVLSLYHFTNAMNVRSRLPILGNLPWNSMSSPRITKQRTYLRRSG
jgi:hypothetical protein